MNTQIFKVCPTLGEYHKATHPYLTSMEENRKIYQENKEAIDRETVIYSTIFNDRKKLGGDDKIHKI